MGRFLEFYRKHVAGTHSDVQLYTGLVLFACGVVLGLAGIFVAIYSDALIPVEETRIEFGVLLSALGLVLILVGTEITLPARTAIHLIAAFGSLVCIIAVFQFVDAYPNDWRQRGEDRSADVVGLYVVGLMALFATTLLALVVNFISRHAVLPGHELDDIFDTDRPVSMDEIMRDIEREVGRQQLTWGGVSEGEGTKHVVKLKADFGAGAYVRGRAGKVTETPVDAASELAYTELMRLRGREGKGTSSEDDTQAAVSALVALRRARQEEMERSWWYRFKRWFFSLFTGPGKSAEVPKGTNAKQQKKGPDSARTAVSEAK